MRVSHKRKLAIRKEALRFIQDQEEAVVKVQYSRCTGSYYIKLNTGQTVRISDHAKLGKKEVV